MFSVKQEAILLWQETYKQAETTLSQINTHMDVWKLNDLNCILKHIRCNEMSFFTSWSLINQQIIGFVQAVH